MREGFNPYFYGTSTSTLPQLFRNMFYQIVFNPYFYGTSTSTPIRQALCSYLLIVSILIFMEHLLQPDFTIFTGLVL